MNGEPLTADHGAPFRLVVPQWYAVASVKWLKRIDVLAEPYSGEFQTGHYIYEWPDRPHEPVDLMRVRARITDPAPGTIIPAGTYTVRGKAWSPLLLRSRWGFGHFTRSGFGFPTGSVRDGFSAAGNPLLGASLDPDRALEARVVR